MDRFQAMQIFTRVSERRSFTLVAEDLGLSRSTVTDAVKQLEKHLGVQLLQRTTRHVSPTLDGEAYYRRCIAILADIEDAEGAFAGAKPKGLLRVNMHGTLARHWVFPSLPDFLRTYPDIEFYLDETDRLVDLVREGIDCVVRVGNLQDSDMIARRLALLEQVTLASPAYIERHGTPFRPDRLQEENHRMVAFHSSATGAVLPLDFMVEGRVLDVTLPSVFSTTAADSYYEAAKLGLGIIQVPRYRAAADMGAGKIVELFSNYPPQPLPVSVLYPPSRQLSPRVRVLVDWLVDVFQQKDRE